MKKQLDLVIRQATQHDLPTWSRMRAQLWPTESAKQHAHDLGSFFKNSKTTRAWIALSKNKPIGFAESSVRPFANGCDSFPVVFLEGIWVDPALRKHGVARSLVQAVENWAKSKGILEIGSDTQLTNKLSQKCHKKWGFEETERVVYFRKILTN